MFWRALLLCFHSGGIPLQNRFGGAFLHLVLLSFAGLFIAAFLAISFGGSLAKKLNPFRTPIIHTNRQFLIL